MEFVAKCPKCDAGLPVAAANAPASIACGRCGREIPLSVSEALREGRAVDQCPVCRGADFYIRKDFDPKVGLTVVIIGALISAAFYWYGRDLIAYSILGAATLIDLAIYGRLKDLTVCYRCHSRVPRRVRTPGRRLRSPHGGRARNGIRATIGADGIGARSVIH